MRRIITIVGAITVAICIFGAVKASSHGAVRPGACAATCDVAAHRVAMNDSMPMPQMGSDSSDMPMGPHMKLTTRRSLQAGDRERANAVVAALRVTLSRYSDYRVAQGDGYKQFMANVKQQRYHFTNWVNALAAERSFDPARPTSLLYERSGDGYKLVGAMYTAPKSATPDELDARIPLSIARWHQHVDICWGPRGTDRSKYMGPGAQFGLVGSIDTQTACDAAGGRFQPVLFNWMVHVYPFETDPASVWRTE
ncbi:MAG TPA: hypothetical protein VJN22_08115 [Candidatus Eremiobacteraceae bacterium]|nr:hypothetical protein [Candidatus Eremiobacteraceae bacterium]